MKVIYKLTYLSGKIFLGKDTVDSTDVTVTMFPPGVALDSTTTREILWQSENATETEVALKLADFIQQFDSSNPAVGYNKSPQPTTWLDTKANRPQR